MLLIVCPGQCGADLTAAELEIDHTTADCDGCGADRNRIA